MKKIFAPKLDMCVLVEGEKSAIDVLGGAGVVNSTGVNGT